MFVALSKVLDWLVAPLSWSLMLLAAAALLRHRPRAPAVLVGAAALVLVVFSVEPVAGRLQRRLEASALRTDRPGVVYDAVVVLGGMVDAAASRETGEVELDDGVDRLVRGFELLREGRAREVLLTAGLIEPQPGDVPEADLLAQKLRRWGIAPDRIVVERASRNTHENAVECARIVRERRWRTVLLVTSAAHMERALGCFRQEGLSPDALPVDFRGGDGRGEPWLPRSAALGTSTDAIREWTGRIVYRLVGYSAPPGARADGAASAVGVAAPATR